MYMPPHFVWIRLTTFLKVICDGNDSPGEVEEEETEANSKEKISEQEPEPEVFDCRSNAAMRFPNILCSRDFIARLASIRSSFAPFTRIAGSKL